MKKIKIIKYEKKDWLWFISFFGMIIWTIAFKDYFIATLILFFFSAVTMFVNGLLKARLKKVMGADQE